MSFKSVLLFCLAVSVSALSTPRNVHHHRALAHRAVAVSPVQPAAIRRRCKPRPSSSPILVPSSSVVIPTVSTPTPSKSNPPAPTTTYAPPPPPTTTKAPPPPPPTTTYAPPPPPTTTKAPPPPPPTTTYAPPPPPPTTTKAPPPPPATTKASGGSGGGPSFMTGIQRGQGTFYATGLGACGIVNKDTDYIAAVSHRLFDAFPGYNGANPNNNPMCGRKVRVTYLGKSVVVALTDRCEGCALTDLDFSPSAFNQIADFAVGRISNMQWTWI